MSTLSQQLRAGILHPWQGGEKPPSYMPYNCSIVGWLVSTSPPVKARLLYKSRVLGSTFNFAPCSHPAAQKAAETSAMHAQQFLIIPTVRLDGDEVMELSVNISLENGEILYAPITFANDHGSVYVKENAKTHQREKASLQRLVVFLLSRYRTSSLAYVCADDTAYSAAQAYAKEAAPYIKRDVVIEGDAPTGEKSFVAEISNARDLKIASRLRGTPAALEYIELVVILESIRRLQLGLPNAFEISDCLFGLNTERFSYLHCGGALLPAASIRRVLVIKVDRIGDVVSAAPALRRLREMFPDARLSLAVTSYTVDVARSLRMADEIAGINDFIDKTWDIAVDLRVDEDTRHILQDVRAHLKLSFGTPLGDPYHLRIPSVLPTPGLAGRDQSRHIVDQLLSLVETLSIHLREFLAKDAAPSNVPLKMVVNLGPSDDTRCWFVDRYSELVAFLVERYNFEIILLGGESERTRAHKFIENLRSLDIEVEDRVGNVASHQLVDLISGAAFFVGCDSGPKHIAKALNLPGVVLHGGRHTPIVWGANDPTIFDIYSPVLCSPCLLTHKADCPNNLLCLRNLDVEVAKTLADLAISLFVAPVAVPA